jgi:hypothetical protein
MDTMLISSTLLVFYHVLLILLMLLHLDVLCSERQLCEALLLWYENREQGPPREDSVILFKKVRF